VPIYEYRCTECADFEQVHGMGQAPDTVECPRCSRPARRRMSAPRLSMAGSAAFRLLDASARSAHEPAVVSAIQPEGRTGSPQTVSSHPLHQKLPRP
jgi:putative FmdB family regulatory protein